MKEKVRHTEATAAATAELNGDDVEEQFAALEKQGEVDRLLNELKSRRKVG
jgi:phage shock protein A